MENSTGNTSVMVAEQLLSETELLVVSTLTILQNVITVIGMVSNMVTLVTLMVNSDGFSDIICLLLKYQSVLDTLVCLSGLLINVLPEFWSLRVYALDVIICHLWHSQFLMWTFICMSTWNLVTLAVDRFICICHPMKYQLLTKSKVRLMIVVCFLLCLLFGSCTPLQAKVVDGVCISAFIVEGPVFESIMAFYGATAFFSYYAIPTTLFIILYGRIIYSFHQRSKQSLGASGASSVIDKATSELTKTSIVVTIIFVLSYSWDLWYYFIGYMGLVEYLLNTPLQKIGITLALINSMANPFVYASLMPAYRRSVQKTFKVCAG